MIEPLDQNSTHLLNILYEKLAQSMVLANKKLFKNSIFLTLLKLSNNDTYKIISNASFKFDKAFHNEVNALKRVNFVNTPDDKEKLDELVINAHGIWYIETTNETLRLDDVLDYIQATKLEFPKAKQSLTDSEKIILYSMLAVRTFSEQLSMDLTSVDLCKGWQDIIENKVIPHLRDNKIIKLESVIDKKTGNEDPISYLMRHANDLPQKTNNIFNPTKKNKYYLSLNTDNHGKCISQISFLLLKIIPDLKSDLFASSVYAFLCDVAHNESFDVLASFDYVTNTWDKIIKESVDQLYLGVDFSSYLT